MVCYLSIASIKITTSQPQNTWSWSCQLRELSYTFPFMERKGDAIPWPEFGLWLKMMDPSFITCDNPWQEGFPVSFNTQQQIWTSDLAEFYDQVWGFKEPILHTPSNIWGLGLWFWCFHCWLKAWVPAASLWCIIRTMQHHKSDSCGMAARVWQIKELGLSSSWHHRSFSTVINNLPMLLMDCTGFTDILWLLVNVSHWLIFCHEKLNEAYFFETYLTDRHNFGFVGAL
jgi:hypothetical protein